MCAIGDVGAVGLTFIIYVAEVVDYRLDVAVGADETVARRVGGDVNDFGIIVSCVNDAIAPFIYYKTVVVCTMNAETAGAIMVNDS